MMICTVKTAHHTMVWLTMSNSMLDVLIGRTRVVDGRSTHWTAANGRIIAIRDMTDDHLMNTLRLIERRVNTAWLQCLDVIYREKHVSENDIDEAMQQTLDVCINDQRYNTLLTEAIQRGLKRHGI
jgi:hypothetical protein